ncbi:MAG: PAS domain S-box protein [Promethearchaeota archaeon]
MKDEDKTKEQLIYELMELHQRITELEVSETLRERAENALQKSELQYRSTLDSMGDFIHVIDSDLRFTLFNKAFKQINTELGLKTDVMGKKILDVFPFLSDDVLNEYKHVFETGKPLFTEEKIIINGREFLTEIRKIPIFEEKQVTHIVTVIRDVTKRKLMENAVRKSEKRFRELAELLPETVFEIDLKGNLAFANRIAFDVFGYSQEDFDRGINAFQVIAPEDHERLKENMSRICNGEDTGINEYIVKKKDGSRLPVIIRSNVIRDDLGNPIGLRGIIIDINERKQAEEKIREYTEKLEVSEERYRGLYESSIDGIVSRDLEGYIVDCNQAFANMLRYTKEELYQFPPQKVIPNKLFDSMNKFIEEQLGPQGYSDEFEIEYIKKDGTFIPASVRVWNIKDKDGNSIGTWAIVRDITERKKLEWKLVESEEKYRTLVEKDPNMIYLIKDGKVVFANQAVVDTLGYSREELYELDLELLLPIIPEQRQIIRQRLKKRLAGEQVPESYEFSVMTKSNEKIPCLLNTTSFEIEGTRVIQGVLTDIRKVKELEKELKKSEARYRGLYESSIDGIVSVDLNGRIMECNQAFADMLGYSKQELRKFTVYDITPGKWRDMNKKFHELLLKGGYFEEFKKEYIKKDGSIVPVAIRGWSIKDKEGKSTGMWGVVRDITEKQKLEEERKQVEKKIRESEERYRGLFENSPISLWEEDFSEVKAYIDKLRTSGITDFRSYFEHHSEAIVKCATMVKIVDVNKTTLKLYKVRSKEEFWNGLNTIFTKESYYVFRATLIAIAEGNTSFESEAITQALTGDKKHIALRWSVAPGYEKTLSKVLVSVIDITERKNIEENMKELKEKYESIIKNIPDIIYSALPDATSTTTFVSEGIKDWTGYSPEEFYENNELWSKCIHPEDRDKAVQTFIKAYTNKQEFIFEYRIVHKETGQIRYLRDHGVPIRDNEGQIIRFDGILTDITERKQLENQLKKHTENLEKLVEERTNALRESEEKLQTILTGIGDLITIQNKNLDIIWANKPLQDIYGDVIGKKCYKVYKGLEEKCPDCTVERVLNEEKIVVSQRTNILPDGSTMQILTTSSPIRDAEGHIVAVVEMVKDITELKELENALKESEKRYRGLYESSIDGIAYADMSGKIIDCNQTYADMLGYTKEKLYNLTFWDLLPSKWHDMTAKIHAEEVITRGYSYEYEKENIKQDGTNIPVAIRVWLIRDKEGNPTGTWAIVRDITERKLAETKIKIYTENLEKLVEERTLELRESEERYRGLYESSIDGIASADMEGNIVECNQAYADMLGYTKEEIYNMSIWDFISNECQETVAKSITEQIIPRGYSDELEIDRIKKDGAVFPASVKSWLIKDKEGNPAGIWAIVRDITERKKLEEEILKTEKLESLGILAGGIAHDFNNILTGILGNIALVKMYAPFGDKVLKRLNEAEKATMRARDLTQQLLTFSKGGAPIKKTASIEELLRDTAVFTLSGSKVKCNFYLPEDLWSVDVDEGQISQVINNLVINADQAMPEGGIIKIIAENVTVCAEDILPLQKGNYIKITIEDQGIGIPKEHLQKIFDPYFTTKHKGSGLGLTIAYSIIKNHDGHITVDSKLGVGSTFSIHLPAAQKQIPKKKEAEKRPVAGKGRIMVMDDDEIIRVALGEILHYLGYQVEFTKNGEEAIALYKNVKDSEQSFDAVILDLTIRGGIGGRETIKELIEIDPDVKAIVSSGYSTDPVMADFRNYGFSGVVAKPYNIKELSETLHRIINKN